MPTATSSSRPSGGAGRLDPTDDGVNNDGQRIAFDGDLSWHTEYTLDYRIYADVDDSDNTRTSARGFRAA